MLLLHRIKKPLEAVVDQAQAISERRFIRIAEPRIPELKSVASAMNAMVERLQTSFAEEAARLEQVRRQATLDSLTGLTNRAFFLNELNAALTDDDATPNGSLLLLRVADLPGINQRAGREVADQALQRIATVLNELATARHGTAARLNGAEFALLLPGVQDATTEAEALLQALRNQMAAGLIDGEQVGHVASALYQHGQSPGNLLARLDAALAEAAARSSLGWSQADTAARPPASSNADWKKLLDDAVALQRLRLVEFPVADMAGRPLHQEGALRLQAGDNGEWLNAGRFMPMAARLALTSELDLGAARLALDRLAAGAPAMAVNLSGESIMNPAFRQRLQALVARRRELAPLLWLEVSEVGAFERFGEFHAFCETMRPLGCRLGIEHFGRRFSEIGRLHDIGLDYLKVDSSFIRAIETQAGYQAFLEGLCRIAHSIGLRVIAEGVQTAEELATLPGLGFDGATGPAIPREP